MPQGGQLGEERVGAEPAGSAAAVAKLVLFLVLGGQLLSLDEGVAFFPPFLNREGWWRRVTGWVVYNRKEGRKRDLSPTRNHAPH